MCVIERERARERGKKERVSVFSTRRGLLSFKSRGGTERERVCGESEWVRTVGPQAEENVPMSDIRLK